MILPTPTLQIAPGSNSTDLYPSWSEIGAPSSNDVRLRSFSVKRGKQFEADQWQAGTGSFVVKNDTRFLDPSYTGGPYYGLLRPGMQVRFGSSYGGTAYWHFRGTLERLVLSYSGPRYGEVTLECSDRTQALSQQKISGDYVEQLTGARILAVLLAAGVRLSVSGSGWALGTGRLGTSTRLGATIPLNAIDAGLATVAAVTLPDGSDPLAHIQQVVDSEKGRLFVDGQGRWVFQDRAHYAPSPPAAAMTLTDQQSAADATHLVYQAYTPTFDVARLKTQVRLTLADGSVVSVIDQEAAGLSGVLSLDTQTQLRAGDPDAYQNAWYQLEAQEDPNMRIESVSALGYNATSFPLVLARELGERVTVLRTPPGPSETITQESVIEGMQLDGSFTGPWQAQYALSPLLIQAPSSQFKLGTARLGTSNAHLVYR